MFYYQLTVQHQLGKHRYGGFQEPTDTNDYIHHSSYHKYCLILKLKRKLSEYMYLKATM